MAPAVIDEDYYMVLDIAETATAETITKSYKRLAFLRHPDRSKEGDATQAFQLIKQVLVARLAHIPPKLGKAYETLKDEEKRRAYDLIYWKIKKTSKSDPTTNPKQDSVSQETAQISAILKAKEERAVQWSKTKTVYNDAIFTLNREIWKLQATIKGLEEIDVAEQAEAAAANSWATWFMSPIHQTRAETEEEKERKTRDRLQRLHSKSFKETDLRKKESELKDYEDHLRNKRQEFDSANRKDDNAKFLVEQQIRAKREREQQEKERLAKEARDKAWKENFEKRQREEAEAAKAAKKRREEEEKKAAEMRKKQQAEEAARKKLEEIRKARSKEFGTKQERARAPPRPKSDTFSRGGHETRRAPAANSGYASTSRAEKEACHHEGWWPKVEGRITCERCLASHYNFLLQCPGCGMKACATCQYEIRPRNRKPNRSKSDHHSYDRRNGTHSPEPHYYDYFD